LTQVYTDVLFLTTAEGKSLDMANEQGSLAS